MTGPWAVAIAAITTLMTVEASGEIAIDQALVIERVGRSGRVPVHTDAVEAAIVAGTWSPPSAGDVVELPDGSTRTWEAIEVGEDGWFEHAALRGGYLSATVELEADETMLLEARGHGVVYVNGVPRVGDPYATGWCGIPVALRAGTNELLFRVGRGRLWGRLTSAPATAALNLSDATLPDVIRGEEACLVGGVVVINATDSALVGLRLWSSGDGVHTTATPVPSVPPLGMRKVPFMITPSGAPEGDELAVRLRLTSDAGASADAATGAGLEAIDSAEISLRVRDEDQAHKRTFVSEVDGSVQYWALQPAQLDEAGDGERPALLLTLHGAGVEATGQAGSYAPKDWCHVVAPTNRRPFGFDWEDWGRLDAMEVLELARDRLDPDPAAIYLSGHSMGGHGTWHVGVTFPDRFAAIAPSAGWVSFWSYVAGPRPEPTSDLHALLRRATNPSDTLALSRNLLHHGVYVLHGDRDDNVPVEQARIMRARLGEFHPDFAYYERPGAGHWWGSRCVDWGPLFSFLREHRLPALDEVDHVEFHTASPGISARSRWATIETQRRALEISSIDVALDREGRRFAGTTTNVERLSLDVSHLEGGAAGDAIAVALDGSEIEGIEWPAGGVIDLVRGDDGWAVDRAAGPEAGLRAGARTGAARKGAARNGTFKDAFRHRFILVFGTGGDEASNAWALAKARYDGETFWYRGNGVAELRSDEAFLARPAEPDRTVVLYGNADTNRAWGPLLGDSPIQVREGVVEVGDRRVEGDDLACLLIRPRPGSELASVGAVAGTGLVGARLTDRLPYFVSGVAYPDYVVIGADALERGLDGVRVAGFFATDWTLTPTDQAWGPAR